MAMMSACMPASFLSARRDRRTESPYFQLKVRILLRSIAEPKLHDASACLRRLPVHWHSSYFLPGFRANDRLCSPGVFQRSTCRHRGFPERHHLLSAQFQLEAGHRLFGVAPHHPLQGLRGIGIGKLKRGWARLAGVLAEARAEHFVKAPLALADTRVRCMRCGAAAPSSALA